MGGGEWGALTLEVCLLAPLSLATFSQVQNQGRPAGVKSKDHPALDGQYWGDLCIWYTSKAQSEATAVGLKIEILKCTVPNSLFELSSTDGAKFDTATVVKT